LLPFDSLHALRRKALTYHTRVAADSKLSAAA
jgi:hypothetical protein